MLVDDGSREPVVCEGATVVRRERCGGPAAARNDGIARVESEFVAFLDSDCVPPDDWIERLGGHFDDPRVAAVAPRIRASDGGRSPLDLGPGRNVRYLPSAALIVRRAAQPWFDPALRYGEDVDLIWRLQKAGWRFRYEPDVVVLHEERDRIKRRFLYGTSAAPLAQRHPDKIRHVMLRPWPVATLLLGAAAEAGRAGVPRAHGAAREDAAREGRAGAARARLDGERAGSDRRAVRPAYHAVRRRGGIRPRCV